MSRAIPINVIIWGLGRLFFFWGGGGVGVGWHSGGGGVVQEIESSDFKKGNGIPESAERETY